MESILPQWQHAQLDTEGATESKASLREEVARAAARVSAGLVTWAEVNHGRHERHGNGEAA